MSPLRYLILCAVLLLVAACAPTPLVPAPAATSASPALATNLPLATLPPGTLPPPTLPPATATEPAATVAPAGSPAPSGWQTYTNSQAGFSISYPPGWTLTPTQSDPAQPMQEAMLEGPEGSFQMQWGTGFGGACQAYSALHVAQGQIWACHSLMADGQQRWALSGTKLPTVTFGGFAGTKDASQASVDAVLDVLATITFDDPAVFPPAPAAGAGEIVVDNAGPDFWPQGDWYLLESEQKYGQDCYQALPGLTTSAEVRPALSASGPYEVFVWPCGNPNWTNTSRGVIEVHRSAGDSAPASVGLNYQAVDAGQWQSVGTYNLQPGAFLNIKGVVSGATVADAYRFVPQPQAAAEVVPTPLPSGPLVSNHPPPPESQVTSGDLAVRLGLTDPWYNPVTATITQMSFDDCEAFPRDGCSGTRDGFQSIVAYEGITLTYDVSSDYQLVGLTGADRLDPWLMGQDHPQRVFLGGLDSARAYFYPNGSWRYLRYAMDGRPESDMPLTHDEAATLQALAAKYSTLFIKNANGQRITFYGLGPTVAPTEEDKAALLAVAEGLAGRQP